MNDTIDHGSADPGAVTDVLAPLSRRAVAQVIDSAIVLIPAAALVVSWGGISDLSSGQILALTSIQVAVGLVYETVGIAVFATTVGKRIFGIRVVRSEDGGKVSWTYAAIRSMVTAIAGLIPYIGPALTLVVYLRAFMHPLRQGLHDAAAGTLVVVRR